MHPDDAKALAEAMTVGETYTARTLWDAYQSHTRDNGRTTASAQALAHCLRHVVGCVPTRVDRGATRAWRYVGPGIVHLKVPAAAPPPGPPTVPSREDWAQTGRGVAALAEPEPMPEEGCPNAAVGGCDRPASEHDENGMCPEPEPDRSDVEGPWQPWVLHDNPCPKGEDLPGRRFGCGHPAWLHGSDGTGPCEYHAGQPDGCGCGEDD